MQKLQITNHPDAKSGPRLPYQKTSIVRRGKSQNPKRFWLLEFRSGFTLLETLIALGVILAATVGPVSLITRGLADFSFSKNKLTAVNLAQEGIELVRSVRDNNVICDALNGAANWQWNKNPESQSVFSNITAGVAVDRTVVIDCGVGGVSIVVPILSSSCSENLRYNSSTGIYGYEGDRETIFSRCVTVDVPSGAPQEGIPASDKMNITSTVQWNERQIQRVLTLSESLYNWR
mgnify:CR=1 FL=1